MGLRLPESLWYGAPSQQGVPTRGVVVGPIDSLMLDAKQAILDEQHRKFQTLQKDGRWPEAMQQFHVTLSCASDVLTESLELLQRVIEARAHRQSPPSASPDSSRPDPSH